MVIDYEALNKVLNDFGDNVTKAAKIKLNGEGIDDTSKLRKSIGYDYKVMPNSFSFSITMLEYGIYVDQGRKKGSFPPVDAIRSWIRSKPVRLRDLKTGSYVKTTKAKLDGLAYVIGRSIKENGIAATNFISDPFAKEFKSLPDDIVNAFGLDMLSMLDHSLNKLNTKQ